MKNSFTVQIEEKNLIYKIHEECLTLSIDRVTSKQYNKKIYMIEMGD